MSAASCLLSEDELQCSICLEVLTDPVSTPCGHNFCKDCITQNWRISTFCRCPVCNEEFSTRPQLKTNVFISAMVAQFRENETEHRCPRHNKPLELFCESDHTCVCVHCSLQHQTHVLLPLKEACEARKRELQKSQAHTQTMILERTQKIRDIQQSLELSQRAADEEAAVGVHCISNLMELLQKLLNEVLQEIEEKQNKAKTQAEALIQALEQEISELKQRSTEVEQLRCSKDHLQVLKTYSLLTPVPLRDCTNVGFRRPFFLGTVQRAMFQIQKQLFTMELKPLSKSHLQELWKSAVNVTLDPDTAHPELVLSADLKQVTYTGVKKTLANSRRRITAYHGVLGKQSVSSGRFYFEVQVSVNTDWALGMATETINKTDEINATPANGFWAIWLYDGLNYGTADPDIRLIMKSVLQRVGVFVDYEEGLILFSDADTAALLYSFTGCSFTEKLYPYFYTVSTGKKKSAPLIITPVRSQE